MNMKFNTLTLQCRKSREVVKFSTQVSFFHGKIATGKSSIAYLIDFCLGGDLVKTQAILQELVSVELTARVEEYDVLFEREVKSNQVQVTWQNIQGQSATVLAPIQALSGAGPIWDTNIFNLSDLIFYLLGVTPIKVRRSKQDQSSPLVRLSFQDIMWYCYLDQDHLDSSFFRLEDPHRGPKSRDVMRFIVEYYTERLSDLQNQLDEIRNQRARKLEAAQQLRTFLKEFDYDSESKISDEIQSVMIELRKAKSESLRLREGYIENTHFTDRLRKKLQSLGESLASQEQILIDLKERIAKQEALRAELLSAKFKLARVKSASAILSGVSFEFCPSCGMKLDTASPYNENVCPLCGRHSSTPQERIIPQEETVRHDLDSRIKELDESIYRHAEAFKKQKHTVSSLQEEKILLDGQLKEELRNYDSIFLSNSREVERMVATLQERIRSLRKILEMPKAITQLEKEADDLVSKVQQLMREIRTEESKLTTADHYILKIEDAFLQSLVAVGVPGVELNDQVKLNRRTWIPSILPDGDEARKYEFYNAGSGGKKTLLNVCYALAVHKVAAEYGLPLPTFLIIDTPMKNIGEDVNRDLFIAFYKYLYELAVAQLSDVQFIIMDKEYIPPDSEKINILERYMSDDDPNHPRLISYYDGA